MAQVRPAAHHAVCATVRAVWVVAWAALVGARLEPVRTPLPDISRHVVETEVVRFVRVDGRGARIPVRRRVVGREGPLEDVHAMTAPGLQLVAPRKRRIATTARGVLPFGL